MKNYINQIALGLLVLVLGASCQKEEQGHPFPGNYGSSGEDKGFKINRINYEQIYTIDDTVRLSVDLLNPSGNETYEWHLEWDRISTSETAEFAVKDAYSWYTRMDGYVQVNHEGESYQENFTIFIDRSDKILFLRKSPKPNEVISLQFYHYNYNYHNFIMNPNVAHDSMSIDCSVFPEIIDMNDNIFSCSPQEYEWTIYATSNIAGEGPWTIELDYSNGGCHVINLD